MYDHYYVVHMYINKIIFCILSFSGHLKANFTTELGVHSIFSSQLSQ